MKMKLILLICLCSTVTSGQIVEATTKDGRTVILRPNKTWDYVGESGKSDAVGGARLDLEAALVFQNGDVVPVSRTKFYLLKKSAVDILNAPDLRAIFVSECKVGNCASPTGGDMLNAFVYDILYPKFTAAALPRLQSETFKEISTDFSGKGTFEGLDAGEYWIVGFSRVRKAVAAWNEKIVVEKGGAKIVLDQNNRLTLGS